MALDLFASLALTQSLATGASEEALRCKGLSEKERQDRIVAVIQENVYRARPLWERVRDKIIKDATVFSRFGESGEKSRAPRSVGELSSWFARSFQEGHTFFVERADGTAEEIGTADPVHVH